MSNHSAPVHRWLAGPVARDVELSIERLAATEGVAHLAVMPDVHLAETVCVGVAVASGDRLFPEAVGRDIGCGMAAMRLTPDSRESPFVVSARQAAAVLQAWSDRVPSLIQRDERRRRQLSDELLATPLSDERLEKIRHREGTWQFGTLGRGNHFLELQLDEAGEPWLMIHSGSRSIGQAIATYHEKRGSPPRQRGEPISLIADSDAGRCYLNDVAWAIDYAAANRRAPIASRAVRCVVRSTACGLVA